MSYIYCALIVILNVCVTQVTLPNCWDTFSRVVSIDVPHQCIFQVLHPAKSFLLTMVMDLDMASCNVARLHDTITVMDQIK